MAHTVASEEQYMGSLPVVDPLLPTGSSSKPQSQERKATPTPREMSSSTKSPLPSVAEHQASLASYERLLQGLGQDVYRGQIPLTFDPATLPRGIPLDPSTTRAGVFSLPFPLDLLSVLRVF